MVNNYGLDWMEDGRPGLYVMCGLQCSGKSTKIKELLKTYSNLNPIVVSSDSIREELAKEQNKDNIFDIDNNIVFKEVYRRINENLKNNRNVIFDATNITIKSRRQIFQNVKELCYKVCHIMNTPYNICLGRLRERNKIGPYIPEHVLENYYKSFEVPFYEEGWDIITIDNVMSLEENKKWLEEIQSKAEGFDQHNKWHNEDLWQHMCTVKNQLRELSLDYFKTNDRDEYNEMIFAASYHDLGKLYTQTFDEQGQAHYYSHENVGAYEMLTHVSCYKIKKDTNLINSLSIENLKENVRYSTGGTLRIIFYINYHMKLHQVTTEKATNKWKDIFGKKLYDRLKLFEKADKYRKEL